jgi:hypothetical protein
MPTTPESYAGGSAGFITNELRNTIDAGGMTASLEKLLLSGRKDIARQGRTAREGVREAGASSGFTGTSANLYADLFEAEAGATESLEGSIGQQAERSRFEALNLLGTQSRFEGQQELAGARFDESKRQFGLNFEENKRRFGLQYALEQERLAFEKEQAEGGGFFEDLATGVLGGVAGIFTGGLASGAVSGLTRSLLGNNSNRASGGN